MQMKNSNVDWLGRIPESWNLAGIKRLFALNAGATPDSNNSANWDGDIIWVTPADFKTQDKFVNHGKRNLSQLGYDSCSATIVDEGSIIFSKRAPIGTVAICGVPLCTNQGCISCTPHSDASALFYYYYLSVCAEQFELYGSGTTFKEISLDNFANFKVALPPMPEQTKIANYLDSKTSEIKSLIDNLNKQIESLKEYKKSLIYKCVTKGLDDSVPLKDSGVEWIGQIPENWKTEPLKYICNIFGRIGFRGYTQADLVSEGEGPITLSPSNFTDSGLNYEKCSYISWNKYYESPEIQINNGDILYAKTASCGKTCKVTDLPYESTINPQIVVLKNVKINSQYLYYQFLSDVIQYQTKMVVTGGTVPTISQEKINNYFIIVPQSNVQLEISNYLDKMCLILDNLVSYKQREINKLNEYEKSLIYEYVTGKKEVV